VIRRLALLSWVLLLSACASKTVRVDDGGGLALISERTAVLAPMQFELEGRVGFSDGKQAGSGEIRWRQERMVDTLDLRVPLAQRSYRGCLRRSSDSRCRLTRSSYGPAVRRLTLSRRNSMIRAISRELSRTAGQSTTATSNRSARSGYRIVYSRGRASSACA
jgi:hypothetical protein